MLAHIPSCLIILFHYVYDITRARNSGIYQKFFAHAPDYIFYTCVPVCLCAYMYVYVCILYVCVYVWFLAFNLVRNLWNPSSFRQPIENATGWMIVVIIVSFQTMAKIFQFLAIYDCLWGSPNFLSSDYWPCVPRDWSSVVRNYHSSPSSLYLKIDLIYTSTTTYILISWCLITHRNFHFLTSTGYLWIL